MSEDAERRAQRWVAGSFFLLAPCFGQGPAAVSACISYALVLTIMSV
jgi:hypothetical protein